MQVGVEEENVVIFSVVLLSETMLVEVLEEIINGLDSGQVGVRFALLMAPETCFPRPKLYLEQIWRRTQGDSEIMLNTVFRVCGKFALNNHQKSKLFEKLHKHNYLAVSHLC